MKELENKLFVTIDVEPDCDIHWARSSPLTFLSITEGIPKYLRPIWDKHSINPIYFVSPEILNNKESCSVLKEEIKKGAIIGAHLHSECIGPNKTMKTIAGKSSLEYPCYAHNSNVEKEKIKNLTLLINKKLGVNPIWYRAARFGADSETIPLLLELGYSYDSSVTPCIDWSFQGGPNHSLAPQQPYYVSTNIHKPTKKSNLIEVPLTIDGKRLPLLNKFLKNKWWFYNWLRPTHMTFFEQKLLVKRFFKKYSKPTFVLMFHSMEILPNKSPYVRNTLSQKRYLRNLDATIAYINKKFAKK